MIIYKRLWKTMSSKNFTTYTLREKYKMSHSTVQRLQKNMHVSTYTLNKLCEILDCNIEDVIEYVKD